MYSPPYNHLENRAELVEFMRANTAHRPALVDELDRTVREIERLS